MKITCILAFILLRISVYSQDIEFQKANPDRFFNIEKEYIYQNGHYLSIGIGKLKSWHNGQRDTLKIFSNGGFAFSTELRVDFQEFKIAPQISYEEHLSLFGVKLNAGLVTDFKTASYVITPELGISIAGIVHLFYGYNFYEESKIEFSKHRISFGINTDYSFYNN